MVLAAVGLGWTFAMLRRWLRPLEILAVAPAVGVAVLVVFGVVVDRLGVRLRGIGGVLTVVIAAAAGAGVAALAHGRGWTSPTGEVSPAPTEGAALPTGTSGALDPAPVSST